MFPFTAECRGLEYFSQTDLAFITPSVRHTPGADGLQGGSLQLDGTYESFIEIPNYEGGWADARQSITLLAFIYPMESSGPVISYGRNGYGVQIWQEGLYGGMGILSAWFVGRDLALAFPLKKAVLHINAWNFIGTSYDRVTGVARLWHNGNEVEAIFIGENFELATQFSIRVGAWESPWQTYYFKGRISHLHIYDEALTVSNIRAVGCIPPTGRYIAIFLPIYRIFVNQILFTFKERILQNRQPLRLNLLPGIAFWELSQTLNKRFHLTHIDLGLG